MKIYISAISDVGSVREKNEDMILVDQTIFRDGRYVQEFKADESNYCFVAVADGVGGHCAGEIASELTLNLLKDKISALKHNLTVDEIRDQITNWMHEIHNQLRTDADKSINTRGMGTTLIGVLIYEGSTYYLNIGDSRLYSLTKSEFIQVSRDHTLREFTGDPTVPPNIIVNSVGGDVSIFCDFAEVTVPKEDDFSLLLCSDGLSDMLSNKSIKKIMQQPDPLEKLVDEAIRKGGKDNISAIHIIYQFDR